MIKIFFTLLFWSLAQMASAAPDTMTCNSRQSAYSCLVCNCYHESRGEPLEGQIAVAKTVLSRKENSDFPDSVCAVVYQPSQFSWTSDDITNNIRAVEPGDKAALRTCRNVADLAINEGPNGILYFHARRVTPAWRNKFDVCGTVGNHVFLAPRGKPARKNCPATLGANRPSTRTQQQRPSNGGTAR